MHSHYFIFCFLITNTNASVTNKHGLVKRKRKGKAKENYLCPKEHQWWQQSETLDISHAFNKSEMDAKGRCYTLRIQSGFGYIKVQCASWCWSLIFSSTSAVLVSVFSSAHCFFVCEIFGHLHISSLNKSEEDKWATFAFIGLLLQSFPFRPADSMRINIVVLFPWQVSEIYGSDVLRGTDSCMHIIALYLVFLFPIHLEVFI